MKSVPDCYFINLDRHPDRRDFMEKQAAQADFKVIRIPAVDARKMKSPKEYSPHNFGFGRWELGPIEQAVFASHRLVWSKIAESCKLGVVMEDDLVFDEKIGQVLSAISEVNEKFDILRLNTSMQKRLYGPEILLSPSLSVRPIFEPMADAGCYALTAEAAQNLLRMSASFCDHLDDFLFSPDRGMSCLQLSPPRASQIIHIEEISKAWEQSGMVVSDRLLVLDTHTNLKGPKMYRALKVLRKVRRQTVGFLKVKFFNAERLTFENISG